MADLKKIFDKTKNDDGWGYMKELRYRIFAFLYFFDTNIVFAKSQEEANEFIERFEDGPQMS